jgi:eukaryotic-like serine/threonine-protein kinase
VTDLRDQLQKTLGDAYTLESELGGGGMSRVFVAREMRFNRRVVVKVLSAEMAAGINAERFEREIRVAASLQQANIVPVLTAGDAAGVPYFTMPFVEGESLRHRLGRSGPLAVNEAVKVLGDIARALAYAHDRGVVHRDIKPDNVLLSGGTAVVTDFGIAKALSASRTGSPDGANPTLTQLGTALGTPAYMAPEQAAADPDTDHRADFYAFGCTAYELLTGRPPFVEKTPQRLLAAHMVEKPESLLTVRPDTPPPLADLVMRCLEKDAGARPRSAAELLQVLDSVSTTSGGSSAAMPAILLGGPGMLYRALAVYAGAFAAVALVAKAAIIVIGLPEWVFSGALIVMAVGLPVLLFTGYVAYVTRRAATTTPTLTPGGTPSIPPQGTIASLALKASPHVTWRRAARGGMYALGAFTVLVVAFMAMRAVGIGPFGSLLAAGKLKAREPILLTDFRVTSGDTSLARVVSFAVRTGLAQSPVLAIVDQAAVAGSLERMEKPRNARVDLPLAQNIAAREGIRAIVDGELTPVGTTGYILTLRLLAADSARVLASFQASGDGPQGLIEAADKVARELRAKAGESLRSVQQAVPLIRARTASLDALRKYSEGSFANNVERDYPKAVRLLREAVTIDTGFAEAWRRLGQALSNLNVPRAQSDSALTRAFQLRARLGEDEQAAIAASYYGFGPGRNREKAIAAYEALVGRFGYTNNNLALLVASRREFARADSLYRADIATDSSFQLAYTNLTGALRTEGKLDAADSVITAGRRRFPRSNGIKYQAILQFFFRNQLDKYQQQIDSARGLRDAADPAWALHRASELALLRGRVGAWRQLRSQALAADSTVGRRPTALSDAVAAAWVQAMVLGKPAAGIPALDAALARSNLRDVGDADRPDLDVARAYASTGKPDKARALVAQFQSEVKDSAVRRVSEPTMHAALAEIALADGKPSQALEEFRRADRLPDGPASGCTICLPFNLGRAFDAEGMADSAIVQFEIYARSPEFFRWHEDLDPSVLAMVHERLGRLYETKGDPAKAAEHLRAFVDLWSGADPELQPRVVAARAKLKRLSDPEPPARKP